MATESRSKLTLSRKALSDLHPAPYNPRKISKEQLERLRLSIEEFDLVEPIIWNKQTENVVGGHQRLAILHDLGRTETDVVVVDLSPAKEKALNLALNKISGDWDYIKLKEVIIEIDTGEFPIELTGFDYQELKGLIDYEKQNLITDADLDEVPEPPDDPISKPGDLWLMGNHRLVCGDSTNAAEVTRLMNGQQAHMIVTDPPYNVNYEDTFGRKILNDNMKDFRSFLEKIYASIVSITRPDAAAYVCYAEANVIDFLSTALDAGLEYRNTLIWLKDVQAMNFGHYTWKYEPILYLVRGKPRFYGPKNHPNVLEAPSFNSFAGRKDDKGNKLNRALHPNQKPVDILSRMIENSSQPGELVVDLFGGSGSTLAACQKTGRTAYLMELDPSYCDVIVKRWEGFTGETAECHHAEG